MQGARQEGVDRRFSEFPCCNTSGFCCKCSEGLFRLFCGLCSAEPTPFMMRAQMQWKGVWQCR